MHPTTAFWGSIALVALAICLIPLIFGILLISDVFDVVDGVKFGVGITILVIGIVGAALSCWLCYAATCNVGLDGGASSGVMMMAVNSGMNLEKRHDFRHVKNNLKIDRQLLIKMLQRENQLRLSEELMEQYEIEAKKWYNKDDPKRFGLHVIDNLQKRVVNEFGFISPDQERYALEYLRSAMALYPGDDEIKNAANYLKYNLIKQFPFNINDYYKDINLLDLNNNLIKLSKIINRDVLNVIISGSIT